MLPTQSNNACEATAGAELVGVSKNCIDLATIHPLAHFLGLKPNELADLVERDSPLVDETTDESLADTEMCCEAGDVEQPIDSSGSPSCLSQPILQLSC